MYDTCLFHIQDAFYSITIVRYDMVALQRKNSALVEVITISKMKKNDVIRT
jgi:hypothetical protein